MHPSIAVLLFGLIFSAPGWAIAAMNVGEPAMWAGMVAGFICYIPFMATACFPEVVRGVLAEH